MIKVQVTDGLGGLGKVRVTKRCQLVTAPLEFSTFFLAEATTINTAFNVVTPKTNKQFVITDIILYADRSVGANGAITVLYEATADNTITISTTIFQQEIPKQTNLALTGLNIIVTEGKWINLKTDDNNVSANIGGYFAST